VRAEVESSGDAPTQRSTMTNANLSHPALVMPSLRVSVEELGVGINDAPARADRTAAATMPLCQIAISATDLPRTHHWYRRALGLVTAGARRTRELPAHSAITDLPELSLDVWCLVDRRDWFQFELFEFRRPRMRPMPADARPSDIGYSMIGFHVADFDEALDRLRRTSGRPLSDKYGPPGQRRMCLRDPEGILLELMEADIRQPGVPRRVRTDVPTATRFIRLSVPDLDCAKRFWVDGLGLIQADGVTLHTPEHESLWGMEGATRRTLLLWAGDFLVELVQYERPAPRWRSAGYLLSDQGILNVALGSTRRQDFDALYERVRRAGFAPNSEPWTLPGIATVVYFSDDQGFSVELLHVEPAGLEHMGFVPTPE
jgi:catechol 2,3-dioxygenase-like lactoylglutathione lyase family enzyme